MKILFKKQLLGKDKEWKTISQEESDLVPGWNQNIALGSYVGIVSGFNALLFMDENNWDTMWVKRAWAC